MIFVIICKLKKEEPVSEICDILNTVGEFMKKRKALFCFILFLLFVGGYFLLITFDVPKVELKIETLSLNEEKRIKDIVSIQKGTLVNNDVIDTQKIGKLKIQVIVKNKRNKKQTYSFEITVVDQEKPIITYSKELRVEEGQNIDLLKGVTASDNSKEDIQVRVEGEYDLKKVGEYTIFYVAEDSSGNKAKEEAKLYVSKKKQTPPSETIPSSSAPDKTFTTTKGFQGVTKNGVTYIDGVLVANKTYSLPSNYGSGLTKETTDAFNKMQKAAKIDGLNIYISSGFRSFNKQNTLYNNYVARDGKKAADTYSARAGYSEHQTGLAFDVNTISPAFANTKEAKWLAKNCYKFGFILRYPNGKEQETGYMYESWHFRYVGEELASKLYNSGDWITLETYFGITSKYIE